jgi:hypothetical protein
MEEGERILARWILLVRRIIDGSAVLQLARM